MSLRGLPRAALAAALALAPAAAAGQTGAGASGGPGYAALAPLSGGETLTEVEVELRPPDAPGAAQAAAAARAALGFASGDRWEPALEGPALARLRALPGVSGARLESARAAGGATGRLRVVLELAPEAAAPAPGLLRSGDLSDFPVLLRDGGAYLKVQLEGGFGLFSDGNPWFGQSETFTRGNPLVQDPDRGAGTGGRATWAEGFVHAGLGGVAPLGGDGLHAFGAATAIAPASAGRDIFRDDARASFDLEQLYAGLLYAPQGRDLRLKASVGRQNFTLNDGFLVSRYASQWNAGPRPGVYLAPRTAHDFSVLASARLGDWSAQGFLLDPNEYEPIESNTQLLGFNLRRQIDPCLSLDATVLHVPDSDAAYRAPDGLARGREGLWAFAGHLRRRAPPDAPGPWFETELAHQRHQDFDMSAWAGYAEAGWIFRNAPWTPSLSYRLAHFTGDDPDTTAYERYDTLYSGGLDHWLQGITINKLLSQANRTTHRLRFNVAPDPKLNLTLDLYRHIADQRNNLGANPALGTLASRELGDEVQLIARWAVSPRVLVMGIASVAFPGSAIEAAAAGGADPWSTLQLQLFWGF
ncbi:MAG: alginate export family protein [Pseudomonadota bacterium]